MSTDQLENAKAELELLRQINQSLSDEKAMLEKQLREYSAHLEQKVRERIRDLEAINEISVTVSRSLDLNVILRDSLLKVLDVLNLNTGAGFLLDDEKSVLDLIVHLGFPADIASEMSSAPVNEECPGVVVLRGKPSVHNNLGPDVKDAGPLAGHPEFKSMAAVPLESKGKVRGVFCLLSRKPGHFTEEDMKLLVTIGSEVGVAIENASLYEKSYAHSKKMEELSVTDSLTGLFNRRHFYRRLKEEMKRAKRQKFPISLLVLDLDDLKKYNDRLGHLKGDEAIRGVAQAINASIRQDVDTGYRYGGDEFAVILPYTDQFEATEVAERIRSTFAGFRLEGTGVSIGLALLKPDEEVDDFVTRADTAMYAAKHSGGNQVHRNGA